MFDSESISIFLLVVSTLILGLFFGVAIGLKINNTDYQYKKIYCPKIYTETNQYIQCMDKPFNDTLKVVLTKK